MDKRRVDELSISYVEQLSLYEEYASRIRNLVQDLIEREGVEFHAIEGWAKTPSDLMKSLSSGLAGENSNTVGPDDLSDIDLVTVRVLLRFPEDVDKIEDVIRSEFDVDMSRSVPSSGLEDPFRFGYPAVMYTLTLAEPRANLREWEKYRGLRFKLELRTMLQEAWAQISPQINLSVNDVSEKKLKRRLVRLAALLEEADEGFLSLRDEIRDEAVLVPPSTMVNAKKDEPVVVERTFTDEELYEFFNNNPDLMTEWNNVALKAGFPAFVPDENYLRDSFGYLYEIFRAANIDTLSDVRNFLQEMREGERALQYLRVIRQSFGHRNVTWRVDPFSAMFLLVLNFKWDILKNKDLVKLNIKRGSDRISGVD